jgi:hypothetical protein
MRACFASRHGQVSTTVRPFSGNRELEAQMEVRSHSALQALGRKVIAPVLIASLAVSSMAMIAIAQDATPEASPVAGPTTRPAHVHTGTCDEVGEVVAPLEDLVAPVGDAAGHLDAVVAETSFTNVPLPLDAILAADHVINVHQSADEIDVYIACGAIGGVLDANGALVIGLDEQDGSGNRGIAYLSPGADGASTDISVFMVSSDGM